jgi:PAS domain S-box-containing protein
MSLHALVVDDEPEVSNLITLLLKQHFDAAVEIAETCAEARQKLSENDFDLVTLDHQLPDGTGLELLREIRSGPAPAPVIMVTAHGDEKIALSAFKSGASGYVVKDSRMSTLLVQEVKSALAGAALEEAEAELRRIEERYLHMFENMTSGVAVYEPVGDAGDFMIRDFNRAAEQIEQVERGEVIGKRVTEAFPGIQDMGFLEVLRKVARTGEPEFYPAVYYEDERHSGWRENRVYRLPTGEVVAIFDDVTGYRTAEAQLTEVKQRLEALLSSTKAVLYRARPYGNYSATYITDNVKALFGYDPQEFYSEDFWYERVHPDDVHSVDESLQQLFESGLNGYEYRFLDACGHYRWIQDEMRLIRGAEGKPQEIIGFFIDVTDRKKSELELIEKNRELEGYVRAMTHDLKGPLSSALSGCSMVREVTEAHGEEEVAKLLLKAIGTTHAALERSYALVDDLLAFAEVGASPERVEAVDVTGVIEGVLKEREHIIRGGDIRVEVNGDLGVLNASPVHVYQVFSNLIGNAIEHGSDSAVVEVSGLGEVAGGGRAYRVRDNGPGLSVDMERMYEPFYKKDSTGTGMGLSIVRKVVELYHGEIKAYNDGGACFEFVIRGLD